METVKTRVCKICSLEKDEKKSFNFHSSTGYYINTCKDCANKKRRLARPVLNGTRKDSIFIRQKLCKNCNTIKDSTKDNFSYNGRVFSKTCKKCYENRLLKIKEEKINKGYLPDNTIKKCIICKEDKTIIDFSYSKKNKYYSSYCKPCDVKRKQEYVKNLTLEEAEQLRIYVKNWGIKNKEKVLFSSYKKFDFNKNLENDLTPEYIKIELEKVCTYCGYPSTGLDRIENSLGHLQSNCVPCCWECNTAKMNNFSYEEMLVIGQAIKLVKNNRKCQH